MQVAFYGVMRHVGTSANMAVVAAGLTYYFKIPAVIGHAPVVLDKAAWEKEPVFLTDCSPPGYTEESRMELIESCDLLVLNVSLPYQELEDIYVRYSLVRKNVIFLIGKYYQDKSHELKGLARQLRVSAGRISAIPYHPAFEAAYVRQEVSGYIKRLAEGKNNFLDLQFENQLKHALHTVMTYGKRKGELFYG